MVGGNGRDACWRSTRPGDTPSAWRKPSVWPLWATAWRPLRPASQTRTSKQHFSTGHIYDTTQGLQGPDPRKQLCYIDRCAFGGSIKTTPLNWTICGVVHHKWPGRTDKHLIGPGTFGGPCAPAHRPAGQLLRSITIAIDDWHRKRLGSIIE